MFPGYELLREIHRGGQGVVYLAIQKATKRRVALKVLHAGFLGAGEASARDIARFEREVQILGQLSHPNVVAVHDSGVASGSFFLVMDYISGRTLDVWMKEPQAGGKPRGIDEVLRLFVKICDAVNAAHLRGVIHRDLKPGNIRVDANNEPHILDFGLAKALGAEMDSGVAVSMTGQFIGSLPWASPEQAEGAPGRIDVRTDVYSLGVMLYQALTGGQFPYRVIGNMRDVLDNILRAEPARPSTVRRQVDDEVETIVLKCLNKERDRRYQSAGGLARDLQRYLAGEPIEAKSDSGWYVITKTLNRYRVQVGVAAVFLLGLAAFAGGMSWLYSRADAAEARAVAALSAEREARGAEAAQRRRAEENFGAVRSLAKTFMFEFDDQIARLRGSTKPRELILKEARDYLARVGNADHAALVTSDPAYVRELADAHEKVGDLQGGLYLPKIGDSAAAAASYAEARRLREMLLAARPDDARAHADMGKSLRRSASLLQTGRKFAEAAAELDRAIGAFDRAVALGGQDVHRDQRAFAVITSGDLAYRLAEEAKGPEDAEPLLDDAARRYAEAEAHWRARLVGAGAEGGGSRAAGDADAEARAGETAARWLGVLSEKSAKCLTLRAAKLGARAEASARDGRIEDARRDAEAAAGMLERAIASLGSAAEMFASMSAERPGNAELRRDLALAHHHAGAAWSQRAEQSGLGARVGAAGKPEEALRARALASYERALEEAEALARADEANLEARRDVAMFSNKVGNELRELDRLEEARTVFGRSLAAREELVRTDPTHRHRRDLGLGAYKAAQVEELLADAAGAAEGERRAGWERAAGMFERSLEAFEGLRAEGVMAENSAEIRAARQGLASVRGKLSGVGAGGAR